MIDLPTRTAELNGIDRMFWEDKRQDEAVRACEEWIERHPRDPWGFFTLALFQDGLGRPDGALVFLDKAIELGLDSSAVFSFRGDFLTKLKRYAEAIASYERVLAMDADEKWFEYTPHFHIAECYRLMGKYKEAIAWCARIPDNFGYPGFHGLVNASKHAILDKIPAAQDPARGGEGGSRKPRR